MPAMASRFICRCDMEARSDGGPMKNKTLAVTQTCSTKTCAR